MCSLIMQVILLFAKTFQYRIEHNTASGLEKKNLCSVTGDNILVSAVVFQSLISVLSDVQKI